VYSGEQLLFEKRSDSNVYYIYLNGKLVASVEKKAGVGTTSYYHTDHLGSTRAITGASGSVVARMDYQPFGVEQPTGDMGNKEITFTGKMQDDPTGLMYCNARYYDPTLGRFITEDPAKDGGNWYIYCANNALKYIDPNGKSAITAEVAKYEWVREVDGMYPYMDIFYKLVCVGAITYDAISSITNVVENVKAVPVSTTQDSLPPIVLYHYGYSQYFASYMTGMLAGSFYTLTPFYTSAEAVEKLALDVSTKNWRGPDMVFQVIIPSGYYYQLCSAGLIKGPKIVDPEKWPYQPLRMGGGVEVQINVPLPNGQNGVAIIPNQKLQPSIYQPI
jgi:RHS repeat-associated protein